MLVKKHVLPNILPQAVAGMQRPLHGDVAPAQSLQRARRAGGSVAVGDGGGPLSSAWGGTSGPRRWTIWTQSLNIVILGTQQQWKTLGVCKIDWCLFFVYVKMAVYFWLVSVADAVERTSSWRMWWSRASHHLWSSSLTLVRPMVVWSLPQKMATCEPENEQFWVGPFDCFEWQVAISLPKWLKIIAILKGLKGLKGLTTKHTHGRSSNCQSIFWTTAVRYEREKPMWELVKMHCPHVVLRFAQVPYMFYFFSISRHSFILNIFKYQQFKFLHVFL